MLIERLQLRVTFVAFILVFSVNTSRIQVEVFNSDTVMLRIDCKSSSLVTVHSSTALCWQLHCLGHIITCTNGRGIPISGNRDPISIMTKMPFPHTAIIAHFYQ